MGESNSKKRGILLFVWKIIWIKQLSTGQVSNKFFCIKSIRLSIYLAFCQLIPLMSVGNLFLFKKKEDEWWVEAKAEVWVWVKPEVGEELG